MPLGNQSLFWLGGFALAVVCVYTLGDVLTPFIAGFFLAYILNPAVSRCERSGIPRSVATIGFLMITVVFLLTCILLAVPIALSQVGTLLAVLPDYADRLDALVIGNLNTKWLSFFFGPNASIEDIRAKLSSYSATFFRWAVGFFSTILTSGQALLNVGTILVITPVVAFYLLLDWGLMCRCVADHLPRKHEATARMLFEQMDQAIGGYIRGQAMIIAVLILFYSTCLTVIGLEFALAISFIAGVFSVIPYVGSMIGFILSIPVAVVQFWPNPTEPLLVFAAFAIGQFIEGYILSPKLVGDRVGLHPVWLIFALFAFGYTLGFLGLLLAIPLAAATAVLARFGMRQYKSSSYYLGTEPNANRHANR